VLFPLGSTAYQTALANLSYYSNQAFTASATVNTALAQVTQALADNAQSRTLLTDQVSAGLAVLTAIPVSVNGLRAGTSTPGAYGGLLLDLIPDSTANIAATFAPGPHGGLLYNLTGGV
jgi:hypothetical protein